MNIRRLQYIPWLVSLVMMVGGTRQALPEEISIAAAADLSDCIGELNAAFQKEHPGSVLKVSTGSSGNFFAQIKNGAPFDIFLSADMSYPRQLADAGLADKE